MHRHLLAGALSCALMASLCPALAGSLEVKPILIDVPAGGAASSLSLTNAGGEVLNAQLRVFRWTQSGGKDELTPTRDVVASPPMAKIAPGGDLLVRVVRTAKTPLQREESYRLIVDELPKPGGNGVQLLVRYSIPVFFGGGETALPKLRWSVSPKGKNIVITATNEGSRRARISGLTLMGQSAPVAALGAGLNGYVLAGQTMQWTVPAKASLSGTLMVTAETDRGPLKAPAAIAAR
jgi:fimbrial chaperone protein